MPAFIRAFRLLDWYDRNRRDLPWRAPPGVRPDPYRVWLAEVMLQQTTVVTVIPYYHAFLDRWPTVEDLAAADDQQVLRAWAGLGYYARARNLLRCARIVAQDLNGRFPGTEEDLRRLPGLGAYTAAAVAAIAFDRNATVVDGNVERVTARLFAVTEPLPAVRPRLRALAATLTPPLRAGDFAQAMMDLGATVCKPRRPLCAECPWRDDCVAFATDSARSLPARVAKVARPTRSWVAFWLVNPERAILFQRRPAKGLLGGMSGLPIIDWQGGDWQGDEPPDLAAIEVQAPLTGVRWRALAGGIRHTFTHFHLQAGVIVGHAGPAWSQADGFWVAEADLAAQALPTVMRKLVAHALRLVGDDPWNKS
ncbi:A/G-specific adenine glycosylase [uncultured Gammaproteobacteria bacterium]